MFLLVRNFSFLLPYVSKIKDRFKLNTFHYGKVINIHRNLWVDVCKWIKILYFFYRFLLVVPGFPDRHHTFFLPGYEINHSTSEIKQRQKFGFTVSVFKQFIALKKIELKVNNKCVLLYLINCNCLILFRMLSCTILLWIVILVGLFPPLQLLFF